MSRQRRDTEINVSQVLQRNKDGVQRERKNEVTFDKRREELRAKCDEIGAYIQAARASEEELNSLAIESLKNMMRFHQVLSECLDEMFGL